MTTPSPATRIRLAILRHFIDTEKAPTVEALARATGLDVATVHRTLAELRNGRVLHLEPDEETIRMAAPFSGVATQHVVEAGSRRYYANCGWDAFGIAAMLEVTATVRSECARTGEPLELVLHTGDRNVDVPGSWRFHSLVPAARWWQDIVFT